MRRPVSGFSLIELLVVTSMVGVLAAVAMPSYQKYIDRGRMLQAKVDIAAVGAIASNYWNDAREYPSSLADIGLAGKLDPWGRPYVYYNVDANGRGHARKDHALNPINTDFDLYSLGPDGVSKPQITQKDSIDDVIRASNGKFVGVAADF